MAQVWTTRRLWCGNILLTFVSSGVVYDSKSITCAQDCRLKERHKHHVSLTIWTREKRQESQVMFGLRTLLQYHGADFMTGAKGQFQSFASLRHLPRFRWIEAPANRLQSSSFVQSWDETSSSGLYWWHNPWNDTRNESEARGSQWSSSHLRWNGLTVVVCHWNRLVLELLR